MDVWKYEINSRVEQDISLVRFAHSWDILVNTRNKFHISTHPCIILYLMNEYYMINLLTEWIIFSTLVGSFGHKNLK